MKIYIVGGAVRDSLMGKIPKDIDYVVVGATPEDMLSMGLKQVGADFPVFINEEGVEYALARIERKTGVGYNGFTTDHGKHVSLEEDLSRRDLTINAIAQDEFNGEIFDPFNGQADIKAKVLRHVSPAFAEDPVRVLRIARFRARYGGDWVVADDTKALIEEMVRRGDLAHLTRERVLLEMEKAFGEPEPELFLTTLQSFGALQVIIPELSIDKIDYRLISNARGGSVPFVYAMIASIMSEEDALNVEDRMGVSNEWRRYARMYRTLQSCRLDSNQVDVLYMINAYRQPEVWEAMIRDLCKVGIARSRFFNDLIVAWSCTRSLGFSELSREKQASLKGPEIAEAIKQMRRKVVTNE